MVEISNEKYKQLLDKEIQYMKYKERYELKSAENRKLQAQLSYYKNKNAKSNVNITASDEAEHKKVKISII